MELIDPDSAKSNGTMINRDLTMRSLGKEDMGMLQSMLFGQGIKGLGGDRVRVPGPLKVPPPQRPCQA